jgi:hypothetical protein
MSNWEVLELPELTQESLQALLDNEVGCVTVPDFIDPEHREAAFAPLMKAQDWSFYGGDGGEESTVGRLGMTQYEHHEAKEAYFAAAPAANARRSEIFGSVKDPVEVVIDAFDSAWPGSAGLAEEDGQDYFAGVFRRSGGDGIAIHADWGPRDGPDWTIGQITGQFAWNLFFSSPGQGGGELIVYDAPWEPKMEESATFRFYDYDKELFKDSRKVEVAPEPGILMVFNSRNAHAVAASPDGEGRVAVGSFIGVNPDGDLAFWS